MADDLFNVHGRARRRDPDTSRTAAERITATGTLGRQARIVLAAVTRWPGRTSYELSENIIAVWHDKLDRYAVARRLSDLERANLVKKGRPRPCRVNGMHALTWEPR